MLDPDKSVPILDPSVWSSLSITDGVVRGVSGWAQHANLRASLRQMNEADGRFLTNLLSEQAKAQKIYEFSAQDKQRIGQKASIRTADRAVIVEVPANEITKEDECEQPTEAIRDSLKV